MLCRLHRKVFVCTSFEGNNNLILNAKIVHNENEGDGSGFVDEEARSVFRGEVSCLGKYLFQFFISKHSRLFQTIHGSSDFHLYVAAVGYEVVEVVLVKLCPR